MTDAKGRTWNGAKWERIPVCCTAMAAATERGTDNEGYSSLVSIRDSHVLAGCDLLPWIFCPWCGNLVDDWMEGMK